MFTDGANSIFHFVFGMIASQFLVIIPIFIIYQLSEHVYLRMNGNPDNNIVVDLAEFFVGYVFVYLLKRG
jgi:hypothetical protein